MTTTEATSRRRPRVQHTPWCSDHANDTTPGAGWCNGDKTTIAGIETSLTRDPSGPHGIYVLQVEMAGQSPLGRPSN